MIAVVGSDLDGAARSLVDAWAGHAAVLISARDLCTRGWTFDAIADEPGCFVAEGVQRPTSALRGVVVRRPAIVAEELPWIAAEDREYVAAEASAFLVAWLSALACPVLNRPTTTSLCGPAWSQTNWKIAALRAGLAWCDEPAALSVDEVVFCGERHHGSATEPRVRCGRALAAESGATLLGVRFAGDAVAAVTLQPALASPGARTVVLEHLADAPS